MQREPIEPTSDDASNDAAAEPPGTSQEARVASREEPSREVPLPLDSTRPTEAPAAPPLATGPAVGLPSELGLRVVGFVGLVSALLVRALESALVGVWSGIDDLVDGVRVLGALLSQVFGVFGSLMLAGLAARVAKSAAPARVRAVAVGIAMMLVLSVAIASGALAEVGRATLGLRLTSRLPVESGAILAGGTLLLSLFAGLAALSTPELRGAGLVLLSACGAGAFRAAIVVGASFTTTDAAPRWGDAAAVLATAEWGAMALAVVLALAWLGTGRSPRLALAAWHRRARGAAFVVLSVGTAVAATYLAIRGLGADPPRSAVFAARVLDLLLDPLPPLVPLVLRVYVECLRWGVASFGLLLAPREALRSVVVVLVLLGASDVTSPLGALSLALGALGLVAIAAERGDATEP